MTNKTWEEIAAEEIPTVLEDFYHPLIEGKATLEDQLKAPDHHSDGTAFFDFTNNEIHMSKKFLDSVHEQGGIEPEVLFRGIYKHELGHYLFYPRKLSKLLYIMHFAKGQFDGVEKKVVAYWFDVMDNIKQIIKEERGRDVRALYRALNTVRKKSLIISQEQQEFWKKAGVDAAEAARVAEKYSVDKLLTGYYQLQGKEDLGVELDFAYVNQKLEYMRDLKEAQKEGRKVLEWKADEGKVLEEKLTELMNINFPDEKNELVNFIRFGTIIADLLKKSKQEIAKEAQSLVEKMGEPMIDDTHSLKDFSDKQVQEALDEIIQQYGKQRYDKIREFVEQELGRTFDKKPEKLEEKKAGIANSKIVFHDDQIPYYQRLARTFNLYIDKKPLMTDVYHSYPEGQKTFKVSDPVRLLNLFSTGGRILPGITKRHQLKHGTKQDTKYKVPDLTIWMDSSGSMPNPKNSSLPVLAAYIAARNYWENGSKVGVVNFSADMALLKPTREIEVVYSFLTAYWGGGTVLNIPKIKEYLQKTAQNLLEDIPYYTTEQHYQELLQRTVPEGKQRDFLDKNITVAMQKPLRELYEKMDTIMITDGGIYNMEEVVRYMNSTAKVTRNIIFIVGSSYEYQRWKELPLPNTQLVPVERVEDLLGLTLGQVRKVFTDDKR